MYFGFFSDRRGMLIQFKGDGGGGWGASWIQKHGCGQVVWCAVCAVCCTCVCGVSYAVCSGLLECSANRLESRVGPRVSSLPQGADHQLRETPPHARAGRQSHPAREKLLKHPRVKWSPTLGPSPSRWPSVGHSHKRPRDATREADAVCMLRCAPGITQQSRTSFAWMRGCSVVWCSVV